jgi:hypothetical protein
MLAAAAHSARAQSPPAPAGQLPPKWVDAVHSLAEKIAAAVGSSREISLDVKNISSLSSADAAAIQHDLLEELKKRHFRVAPPSSAKTKVDVTLSEGVEGYVWSVEIHRDDANQTFLLAVPRETRAFENSSTGSLTLDAKLVWEQPEKFLDFKLFVNPVGAYSTLVILNSDDLTFYRSADSGWHLWHTVPIPHSAGWPRDLHGGFNMNASFAELPGVRCFGDFEKPESVECSPWTDRMILTLIGPNMPGLEGAVGDLLWDKCGDKSIALVSGMGDWTEPDTLQGYLFADYKTQAVRSGRPINFDGPVIAMQREGRENAARAVVHDLRTGNYEAYLVTATCSH